ncbi:MAG TPA: glycosyltransferase family 1 protein [Erysipelotrichaceae bacterium]|nr:glycosyltransferase family 1 protein [Erysipelotrichaceae bacterium]
MKKVLFVATVVRLHINMFHKPFIKWFHDQGWQVDVAANNDYENMEECIIPYCDNFYCLPFERSPFKKGNLDAYFQLKRLLEKEKYDIIHCHTPMGSVIARLAAGETRKRGTKVIYTAHGFHFFSGAPMINWLVYYPIERILAHRTDLLITMNQEDYNRAMTFKAKKTALVNGVGLNMNKFVEATPKEKQEVRCAFKLKEEDIFAISVAQLIKRKNHIVLIKAVEKLHNPHFHLFICGDGVQEAELKAKAKDLGIEHQIHFLGFRKDVYKISSAADLFLLASLQEGLPVAIMEAMACGLPIVASKVRGNYDLIDQGKGGYLVAPMDVDGFVKAIHKIIENKERLEKMKQYNLRKVQKYSIEAVVEQMAELYQDMM